MVPISALISFVLLGIEEIGVYIEEPFSLLPLESLCDKLDKSIKGKMFQLAWGAQVLLACPEHVMFTHRDD